MIAPEYGRDVRRFIVELDDPEVAHYRRQLPIIAGLYQRRLQPTVFVGGGILTAVVVAAHLAKWISGC